MTATIIERDLERSSAATLCCLLNKVHIALHWYSKSLR